MLEYGPFGTGTIGTRDQDGNNGYFIYDNDGGNKLEYGVEVD